MEERLAGGNAGGASLVDGTVRRTTGPWTPAVHAMLRHLEARGFAGAPRVLGIDAAGREELTYLDGETVGDARPWPDWAYSRSALLAAGRWLRRYHDAVADFVPTPDAAWRLDLGPWRPGWVVGHNDAAPYNAVWDGTLVGFIDWDFACPCPPTWDLAYLAFSWVPLHAREVVIPEGFTDFASRPRRLRLLLDAYGYDDSVSEILDAVHERVRAHIDDLHALVAAGDPFFARLVGSGTVGSLEQALVELDQDRASFDA